MPSLFLLTLYGDGSGLVRAAREPCTAATPAGLPAAATAAAGLCRPAGGIFNESRGGGGISGRREEDARGGGGAALGQMRFQRT